MSAQRRIRECMHEALDLDRSPACPGCGHSAVSIILYLRDRLERYEGYLSQLAEASREGTGHLVKAWNRIELLMAKAEGGGVYGEHMIPAAKPSGNDHRWPARFASKGEAG